MKPEERAEKIFIELFVTPLVIDPESIKRGLAAQIAEAEREAFANGRLDAQYDADTLPEQIEAYKRKAFSEGFAAAKAKAAGVVREKYFQAASEDSCAEEWLAAEIEALEP